MFEGIHFEKTKTEMQTAVDYEKKIVTLQTALNALLDENVSIVEKNKLLKTCIDRITYHRAPLERIGGKGNSNKCTTPPINLNITLKV